MSKTTPASKSRRRLLFTTAMAITATPLFIKGFIGRSAYAALPHLTKDDPAAKALGYRSDATRANRTDKADVSAKDQFCHNCRFIQSDSGEWRPCQVFPGKTVNANGWCSSWTPKS